MRRKATNVWRWQWWKNPNIIMLLTTCNGDGYGCPLGCKGKKGCGSVECKTRLRPDGKGEPIANIYFFANTNL
jgi:hypothetical protein